MPLFRVGLLLLALLQGVLAAGLLATHDHGAPAGVDILVIFTGQLRPSPRLRRTLGEGLSTWLAQPPFDVRVTLSWYQEPAGELKLLHRGSSASADELVALLDAAAPPGANSSREHAPAAGRAREGPWRRPTRRPEAIRQALSGLLALEAGLEGRGLQRRAGAAQRVLLVLLAEADRELHRLQRALPAASWVWTAEGRVQAVREAAVRLRRVTAEAGGVAVHGGGTGLTAGLAATRWEQALSVAVVLDRGDPADGLVPAVAEEAADFLYGPTGGVAGVERYAYSHSSTGWVQSAALGVSHFRLRDRQCRNGWHPLCGGGGGLQQRMLKAGVRMDVVALPAPAVGGGAPAEAEEWSLAEEAGRMIARQLLPLPWPPLRQPSDSADDGESVAWALPRAVAVAAVQPHMVATDADTCSQHASSSTVPPQQPPPTALQRADEETAEDASAGLLQQLPTAPAWREALEGPTAVRDEKWGRWAGMRFGIGSARGGGGDLQGGVSVPAPVQVPVWDLRARPNATWATACAEARRPVIVRGGNVDAGVRRWLAGGGATAGGRGEVGRGFHWMAEALSAGAGGGGAELVGPVKVGGAVGRALPAYRPAREPFCLRTLRLGGAAAQVPGALFFDADDQAALRRAGLLPSLLPPLLPPPPTGSAAAEEATLAALQASAGGIGFGQRNMSVAELLDGILGILPQPAGGDAASPAARLLYYWSGDLSQAVGEQLFGTGFGEALGDPAAGSAEADSDGDEVEDGADAFPLDAIIPHHETFSTTIQPPYSSTKG
jgi:hypothetical protein